MAGLKNLQAFKNSVGIKFQLYNSLFTSLPFHRIEKTGVLVSLLMVKCEEGYKNKKSPIDIINDFIDKQTTHKKEEEKLDLLFQFVQYMERQVVLFDSLEDAAFTQVNDMHGTGTLKNLAIELENKNLEPLMAERFKDFNVRLVLTAHPTQFYRGAVLGIIHDLSDAVGKNAETEIYSYLQQLGRTPFFQKQKPTPFDEAVSLIWYLENIFYHSAGRINVILKDNFKDSLNKDNPLITLGFWPGGDRDGNPFVTADVTLKVSEALRNSILRSYYKEVRNLKRRLTFKDVDVAIIDLEKRLHDQLFDTNLEPVTKEELINRLVKIKLLLIYNHNNLFVELVEELIGKIEIFGLHFASLDVRQDSSVHVNVIDFIVEHSDALPKNYKELNEAEKMDALVNVKALTDTAFITNDLHKDTIEVVKNIHVIQQVNGELGCNRYIISQCNSALNVMEVFGLFMMGGWSKSELDIDIVPLFETVDDLKEAAVIMEKLYTHPVYKKHLANRGNKQTIMLGFSDGTKDGGYMMANWCIYKAKETLTCISKQYGIDVVFFDGRGGPPSRGGGKTHKFYASMGKNISNKEIQLTVQGQTVSSNFGTIESAQFNIEQLLHAGLSSELLSPKEETFNDKEEGLLLALSEESYKSYVTLKDHPYFIDYLAHASPLKYYAETNIGSRPAKRGGSSKITLKDLRAIPYVGSLSQLKQNVTGYYGLGTALKKMEEDGKWSELKKIYQHSMFFKTLMDNAEMAMRKCYFPLTAFLSEHPLYGEIWNMIYDEYELTKRYLLKLSGNTDLMDDYPVEKLSIQMREKIVLPLLTIQQFAINRVREMEEGIANPTVKKTYEKLIMRCSFGIINAGRNSA